MWWFWYGMFFYLFCSEVMYIVLTQIVPIMAVLSVCCLSYGALLCILVSRSKDKVICGKGGMIVL